MALIPLLPPYHHALPRYHTTSLRCWHCGHLPTTRAASPTSVSCRVATIITACCQLALLAAAGPALFVVSSQQQSGAQVACGGVPCALDLAICDAVSRAEPVRHQYSVLRCGHVMRTVRTYWLLCADMNGLKHDVGMAGVCTVVLLLVRCLLPTDDVAHAVRY